MRSLAIWSAALAIVALAAANAPAGWVWRNGRWKYVETKWPEAPAPSPAPAPEPPKAPPAVPPSEKETPPAPAPEPPKAPPAAPPSEKETPPAPKPAPEPAPEPVVRPAPEMPPAPAPEPKPAPAVQPPAAATETPAAELKPPWYAWWRRSPNPNPDRTLFEEGSRAMEAGNPGKASRTLRSLIKKYPDSAYRAEAMWRRGEALFAQKDYYQAFEQYEEMLTQYAGSPHYRQALERQMAIAELYLGPVRRRVWGMPLLSGETEAIEILRRVYEHQPAGDLAEACLLRIADYYYEKGQWQEAEDYYNKYCQAFPNGGRVVHAELARAKCAIARCSGARYDVTSLGLAYDRLRRFQQKYPDAAQEEGVADLLAQLRLSQAEALYNVAAHYFRAGKPLASAFYAEQVVARYADTPSADEARALLAKMNLEKESKP
ncbi:MAG: outer membrane protein assembly factor BamD [Planctomycetota bacterium]|nr:outer membrane protein assembly factor BamD [Planctomycetota bacterium]